MHIHIYIYIYYPPTSSRARACQLTSAIHQYLAILQTPISHYCNTLQSPIQQSGSRLQSTYTAECSLLIAAFLKGYDFRATARHRPPQAATGWPTFWPQIASNPIEINENQ